jgi:hypothetical protein
MLFQYSPATLPAALTMARAIGERPQGGDLMAFFSGMPFPAQFLLAFVVVLALIGTTAWLVHRLGGGRMGGTTLRGRQPRLAVVDYASVDGRRRLVLVRRDNVEHLVMIGGPSDIVVEANIVRSGAGLPARVPAVIDPLPRAIPMPEGAAASGAPNPAWAAQPEVSTRTQRGSFAAFGDDLGPAPHRPQTNHRTGPVMPRPDAQQSRQENRQDRPDTRQEPRLAPLPPAAEETPQSTDQALFEMAQQLEAALRKPVGKADNADAREPRPAAMPRPMPWLEPATPADEAAPPPPPMPFSTPRPLRGNALEAVRGDAKPQASGKPLADDDNLDQEMASLLGRSSATK